MTVAFGGENPPHNFAIGILGGSFNPVHRGHIALVEFCMEKLELDRGVLVPSRDTCDKLHPVHVPVSQRLAMCRLALEQSPRLSVSDWEARQEGSRPVYTAEMLRVMAEAHSAARLYFIMGSDVAAYVTRWAAFEALCQYATLVVVKRREEERDSLRALRDSPAEWLALEGWQPTPYSSTEIRRALGKNLPLNDALHPEVLQFIRENDLYREA